MKSRGSGRILFATRSHLATNELYLISVRGLEMFGVHQRCGCNRFDQYRTQQIRLGKIKKRSGCGLFNGVLSALVLIASASFAWASVGGSISGTVKDPSGAVMPNAAVVATNSDTGAQTTVTTDDRGAYTFPVLPVGHYVVEIDRKSVV